jgi:hypothetical protein
MVVWLIDLRGFGVLGIMGFLEEWEEEVYYKNFKL